MYLPPVTPKASHTFPFDRRLSKRAKQGNPEAPIDHYETMYIPYPRIPTPVPTLSAAPRIRESQADLGRRLGPAQSASRHLAVLPSLSKCDILIELACAKKCMTPRQQPKTQDFARIIENPTVRDFSDMENGQFPPRPWQNPPHPAAKPETHLIQPREATKIPDRQWRLTDIQKKQDSPTMTDILDPLYGY